MPEIILNPVVDSLDGVPESHRDLYEARDGGQFVLAKPVRIDDAAELKGALAQEREARRKLAEKSGQLPPEIQEKVRKAEELERRELERQGEYQKLLQTNEERFKGEITKREERIGQLSSTLERTLTTNAATIAISSARGDVEGLLPHIMPALRTIEEPAGSGNYEVMVIDPKNPDQPRLNAKGQPMTVEELVAEKREHRTLSKLFDASPASGSGGQGSSFRPGQPRIVTLTADEAKDPRRYQQLKAAKQKGEIEGVVDHEGRRLM
jgi:hypothetical protein